MKSRKENGTITVLADCPRCGGQHVDLLIYAFTYPIELEEDTYDSFALCPNLDEPIFVRRTVRRHDRMVI